MRGGSKSETITENIFREFYGNGAFIEKSAILSHYGFKSKKGTGYKGYPDFFRDNANEDFVIIVEAKADDYKAACEEVEFYAKVNKIDKRYSCNCNIRTDNRNVQVFIIHQI